MAEVFVWARGVNLHPLGPVTVAWKRMDGRLQISVDAPDNLHVELLP